MLLNKTFTCFKVKQELSHCVEYGNAYSIVLRLARLKEKVSVCALMREKETEMSDNDTIWDEGD